MNVIQILFQGVFPKRSLSSIKIVQAERKDKQGERKKGLVRFFRTAAGFIKKQNEFIQFCISEAQPNIQIKF